MAKHILDIEIAGEAGDGKSTIAWLFINTLETFGAKVNVTTRSADPAIGEEDHHVQQFRDFPHNLVPGQLSHMTVNITTKTIEREEE